MSGGNVLGQLGIAFTIFDTEVDAVLARNLVRLKAFREEAKTLLSLPMNAEGGAANFGMSRVERAAAGQTSLIGGLSGGGSGIGSSSFVASARSSSPAASIPAASSWRILGGPQQTIPSLAATASTGGGVVAAAATPTGGVPAIVPAASGITGRSNLDRMLTRLLIVQGVREVLSYSNAAGEIFNPNPGASSQQVLNQQRQAVQSFQSGLLGSIIFAPGNLLNAVTGSRWGFEVAEEGAQSGLDQVDVNTRRIIRQRQERTRLASRDDEIAGIDDPNAVRTQVRAARAKARAERSSVSDESFSLNQQMADARSANDQKRISEISSKIDSFNETRQRRLDQIDSEETQTINHIARIKRNGDRLANIQLDTEGGVLQAGLSHSPTAGRLRELQGGYLQRETQLSFDPSNAEQLTETRRNHFDALKLFQQDYLESFRGTQVSKLETDKVTNPRDDENPAKVLREIQTDIQNLLNSVNNLVSD